MSDPTQSRRIILTYEDYLSLPDDRNRYQILEGELAVAPSPSVRHQKVSRNLELVLFSHVKARHLGEILYAPVDIVLDDINIVVPDMVFVSKARESFIKDKKIAGSPDLIIEILSPSSLRYDRISKTQIYAKHGVEWYWIVDADHQTIEEYHLEDHAYKIAGTYERDALFCPQIFPELQIPLSQVWA
ncbi:MAG: Uma2 family endonuclease [Armatimonadetes bacterium]|nr:Uma2 family endonuclease [Armatimonadota bacterium]